MAEPLIRVQEPTTATSVRTRPLGNLQTVSQAKKELETRLLAIHEDLQLTQNIGLLFVKRQDDLRTCFAQLEQLEQLEQQQGNGGLDSEDNVDSAESELPLALKDQLSQLDKEFQEGQNGLLGLKGLIDAQLPSAETTSNNDATPTTSVLGPSALPSSALPVQNITKPRRHKVVMPSGPSINDPAFPVQIQEELLNQVRYWTSQAEMKEKQNQEYDIKIQEMERIIEALNKQRRMREESEERQKEDQWNLELLNQELRTQNSELQAQLSKSAHENLKLQKSFAAATEQLEQLKDKEEKTAGQLELTKTRHEQDMQTMRKHTAGLQRDKSDLLKKMEELNGLVSLQEKKLKTKASQEAAAAAAAIGQSELDVEPRAESPDQPEIVIEEPSTPVDIEPSNLTSLSEPLAAADPKQTSLARETSFAHQQAIISELQTKLSQSLSEKDELKKLLADREETIEHLRFEGSVPSFTHALGDHTSGFGHMTHSSRGHSEAENLGNLGDMLAENGVHDPMEYERMDSLASELEGPRASTPMRGLFDELAQASATGISASTQVEDKEVMTDPIDDWVLAVPLVAQKLAALETAKESLTAEAAEAAKALQAAQEAHASQATETASTAEALKVAQAAQEEYAARVQEVTAALEAARAEAAEASRLAKEAQAAKDAHASELAEVKAAQEAQANELAEARATQEAHAKELAEAKAAHETHVKELAEAKATHETHVKELAEAKAAHETHVKELAAAKAAHESHVKELAEVRAAREAYVQELADTKAVHETYIQELAEAKAERDVHLKELAQAKAAQETHIKELEQAKAAVETHAKELEQAKIVQEAYTKELTEAKTTQETFAKELEQAKVAQETIAKELAEAKIAQETYVKELAEAKAAQEVHSKELAEAKTAQETQVEELEQAKATQETYAKELTEAKAAQETYAKELTEAKATQETYAKELAEAKATQETYAKELTEAKTAQEAYAKELTEAKAALATFAKELAEAKAAQEAYAKQLAEAQAAQEARAVEVKAAQEKHSKELSEAKAAQEAYANELAEVKANAKTTEAALAAATAAVAGVAGVAAAKSVHQEGEPASMEVAGHPAQLSKSTQVAPTETASNSTQTAAVERTHASTSPRASIDGGAPSKKGNLADIITGKPGTQTMSIAPVDSALVTPTITSLEVAAAQLEEDEAMVGETGQEPVRRKIHGDAYLNEPRRHTCDMSQGMSMSDGEVPPVPDVPLQHRDSVASATTGSTAQRDAQSERDFRVSIGSAFGCKTEQGSMSTGRIRTVYQNNVDAEGQPLQQQQYQQQYLQESAAGATSAELESPGRPASSPPTSLLAKARTLAIEGQDVSSSTTAEARSGSSPEQSGGRAPSIHSVQQQSSSQQQRGAPPTSSPQRAVATGAAVISGPTRTAYTFHNNSSQVHAPNLSSSNGHQQQQQHHHHVITDSSGASIRRHYRPSPNGSISSMSTDYGHDRRLSISSNYEPNSTPTDPTMIQIITQTMIGDYLWKYTRRPMASVMSEKRHRRYFWVHPYTRTMYWSMNNPAADGTREQRAKSALILAVYEVTDENPVNPSNLPNISLIVQTSTRNLKLTAPNREKHDLWFQSLSYLLSRPTTPGADVATDHQTWPEVQASRGVTSDTLLTVRSSERQVRKKGSMNRLQNMFGRSKDTSPAGSPRGLVSSSSHSVVTGGVGAQGSGNVIGYPGHTGPNAVGGHGTVNGGPIMAQNSVDLGMASSPRSRMNEVYNARAGQEHDDGLMEEDDEDDDEDGVLPEHVRQCCDGRHDIGALHHSH